MAPPSPLAIATQALERLVKEERYYHKELASQEARVSKAEKDMEADTPDAEENAQFVLKQERSAVEETRAVFEPLKKRIAEAVDRLKEQMAFAGDTDGRRTDEMERAVRALAAGKKVAEVE